MQKLRMNSNSRRGSTLLIVVALLGLLSLVGFVFFTFAAQENRNARNFSEAAKHAETDINFFDWGMQQVIIGPPRDLHQSALWPGRHSIIPNAYGTDTQPHNGEGFRVITNSSGDIVADLNHDNQFSAADVVNLDGDGTPDQLVDFNDSPTAHFGNLRDFGRNTQIPAGDVDYTYPDINNVFLSWDSEVLHIASGEFIRVIIPSFHRPQLLRYPVVGTTPTPIANWQTKSINSDIDTNPTFSTKGRVLHPHPDHAIALGPNSSFRRFLDIDNPADAAAIASLPGGSGGWPFKKDDPATAQIEGSHVVGGLNRQQGVWSFSDTSGSFPAPPAPMPQYDYHADNDNDGTKEGVYLDLAFPVQETDTGVKFVPMYSFTIRDLDSRVNMNIAGNVKGISSIGAAITDISNGLPFGGLQYSLGPDGVPGGPGDDDSVNGDDDPGEIGAAGSDDVAISARSISRSHLGLTPAEINPIRALLEELPPVPAGVADPLQPYIDFFGRRPTTREELANMAWWFLNFGRHDPTDTSDYAPIQAGRYGEMERLFGKTVLNSTAVNYPPLPGVTSYDDNRNYNYGSAFAGERSFRHPLDLAGTGRTWGSPFALFTHHQSGTSNQFPRYFQYGVSDALVGNPQNTNLDTWYEAVLDGTPLMLGTTSGHGNEDPMEITLEPNYRRQPFDEPRTIEDVPWLEFSDSDLALAGIESSLEFLAPAVLHSDDASLRRATRARRQLLTTMSWDKKTHSISGSLGPDNKPGIRGVDDNGNGVVDDVLEIGAAGSDDRGLRAWEWNADSDGNDRNNDGIPDGDGRYEFPPSFSQEPDLDRDGEMDVAEDVDGDGLWDNVFPFLNEYDINFDGVLDPEEDINGNGIREFDPFRPQLRRLLRVELENPLEDNLIRKLSINGILDVERTQGRIPNEIIGNLEFRPLIPHPTETFPAAPVPRPGSVPFPPQTSAQQESWARYDRQRMCQDIFVLLYTLGGGQDSADPTTANTITGQDTLGNDIRLIHDDVDLQQMAQFAVNLVDQLDPDDTITRFEYDKNLADGWNLGGDAFSITDDDPIMSPGTDPGESAGDRGVVYGVERQLAAISEVESLIAVPSTDGSDHSATLINDSETHNFLYVELATSSPFAVDLSDGNWQLEVELSDHDTMSPIGDPVYLHFLNGALALDQPYTIASADTASIIDPVSGDPFSEFRVDLGYDPSGSGSPDLTSNNSKIIPRQDGQIDLDLVASVAGTPPYAITDANGTDVTATIGALLTAWQALDLTTQAPAVTIRLRRRLNLLRTVPTLGQPLAGNLEEQDNPWVTVDQCYFPIAQSVGDADNIFQLTDANTPSTAIENELQRMASRNRTNVLESAGMDRVNFDPKTMDSGGARNNTFGVFNSTAPANIWQPHFDRDFGTVIELFSVPLFGPDETTAKLKERYFSPFRANDPDGDSEISLPPFVGQKVLSPLVSTSFAGTADPFAEAATTVTLAAGTQSKRDNRWHRVFEFLEVPTKTHQGTHPALNNPLLTHRTPGKINLCTIKDPRVLAALLDDQQVMRLERDWNNDGTLDPLTEDVNSDGALQQLLDTSDARDWWSQFTLSRDTADSVTGLNLPGVVGSNPFRSLSEFRVNTTGQPALESTIFRHLPVDGLGQRRLFELGTAAQFTQTNAVNTVVDTARSFDPILRHRMLSKLMNNTTNRSNVFVVYVTIGFFECIEVDVNGDGTDEVRIGGRFDMDANGDATDDIQRAFFIVDRSNAEEAYDRATGQFDWRQLIKYEKIIIE